MAGSCFKSDFSPWRLKAQAKENQGCSAKCAGLKLGYRAQGNHLVWDGSLRGGCSGVAS